MNVAQAQQLAYAKMKQHGLHDWRLDMNTRMVRTFGMCCYSTRTIKLGVEYVKNNSEEMVLDTILHEIAHALTPGANHGKAWKAKCVEIGAKPLRCNPEKKGAERKWQLCVALADGTVERLRVFQHRRSCMRGRAIRGRPETLNRLEWRVAL